MKGSIFLVLILLVLISCNKDDSKDCVVCEDQDNSSMVRNEYFMRSDRQFLFLGDSSNPNVTFYEPCDSTLLNGIEDGKIFVVMDGEIFNPCPENELKLIKFSNFDIIENCISPPETSLSELNLRGLWNIYSIKGNESNTNLPCETFSAYIIIETENAGGIEIAISYDEQGGIINGSISENEIVISSLNVGVERPHTQTEQAFWINILQIFGVNEVVVFTIENNWLRITNESENLELILFSGI